VSVRSQFVRQIGAVDLLMIDDKNFH
jgi:hypothetical protein